MRRKINGALAVSTGQNTPGAKGNRGLTEAGTPNFAPIAREVRS